MRNNLMVLLTGVGLAALLVGGCASQEAVRSDEGLVPKVESARVEVAKPEVKPLEQAIPSEPSKPMEQPIAPAKQVEQQADKSAVAGNIFETVYFDFDKSDLRQDARDVLSRNAEIMMKSKAGAKIQIEGHCDERGSAEYNLALGERRAKSSLQYLTTLGVKAERLSIISYGKEKPAVQGSDEASWGKNRRSEFVVVK